MSYNPNYIAHLEERNEYQVIPAADYSADLLAKAMPSQLVFGYFSDEQLNGTLKTFPVGLSSWTVRYDPTLLEYVPVVVEGEEANKNAAKCAEELNSLITRKT